MIHQSVATALGILCATLLALGPARADIVVTGQQATITANGVAASPSPNTPGPFSHTNGGATGWGGGFADGINRRAGRSGS